jgi:Tol biopolymer transport system component
VGYMSPEQASGMQLDFRSDQFSLGSILYEMATGRRAFQKKTAIDTLAAILNEEPEAISAVNPQVPAPLRWIVERCLAKEPRGRYAATEDLAKELQTVSLHFTDAVISGSIGIAKRRGVRSWVAPAAIAVSLALGAFLGKSLWGKKAASPPRFQRVTYQRSNITRAVFAPDGQTIVYSVYGPDRGRTLLETRVGSRESRHLGIADAVIASISSSGEMALIEDTDAGTVLALASLGGGQPRPALQGVVDADWAPDGKRLAIVRLVDGKNRVEFPVGTKLDEGPPGTGGRLRVSPRGDKVAFQKVGNEVVVVDADGKKRTVARDAHDFAWSPAADEIWLTRIARGSTEIYSATLEGNERLLVSLPGDFVLHDITRGGRVLLERGSERWDVLGRFPGDKADHAYAWLDATMPGDLSADGKTLLFIEKEPGWKNATAYVRKTDGSPAVALGEGFCWALSPDGKWAVCQKEFRAPTLFLMPTGPGEQTNLPNGGLEFAMVPRPSWLPDGKRIVFSAHAPGRPLRTFVQKVDGGLPVAITPEGVETRAHAVSPDGKLVIGSSKGSFSLYPIEGGDARPIPGLASGDLAIQWTADGKALYLMHADAPGKIWLFDLASGRRRLWKELQPPEPSAASSMALNPLITPDGQSYVHTYSRWLADLYVLDGLR